MSKPRPVTLYMAGYRRPDGKCRYPHDFFGLLPPVPVVDVRDSRSGVFLGYNGDATGRAVHQFGHGPYFWIRDLGNVPDARGIRTYPPTLRSETRGMDRLAGVLCAHGGAVIFCACAASEVCHRRYVAERAAAALPGLVVVDLDPWTLKPVESGT